MSDRLLACVVLVLCTGLTVAAPQIPGGSSPAIAASSSDQSVCIEAVGSADLQLESNPESALQQTDQAIAAAQAEGNTRCLVLALIAKARSQRYLGKLAPAEATLREAIERAEQAALPEQAALARARLGQALEATGDLDQALAALTQAVAESQPFPATQADALNLLGHVYHIANRFQEAESSYQQSLATYRELGITDRTASVLLNLAVTARAQEELGESESLTQLALKQFEQNRDRRGVAAALHNLGAIQLVRGELDLAMDSHREALVLRERLKDGFGTSISRTSLAKVLLARAAASTDGNAALRWRREAIELLELAAEYKRSEQTKPSLMATVHLLSEAYALVGDYARAYSRLNDYTALKEDVYNAESSRRFAEFAQKFELDRKAAELAGAQRETRYAQSQAEFRRTAVIALALTCLFGLAMIAALTIALRSRRRVSQADAGQRIAEQQLLAAIHAAPAGIVVVSRDKQILKINRAALQALCLGESKIEEFVGQPLDAIRNRLAFTDLDGRPLDNAQLPFSQVLQTARLTEQREIIVLDGREGRRVLVSAAPVFAGDGSVYAGIIALIDLTELRTIESEQTQLRARLASAERSEAIHLALGGIAHDFSNQLATALGYAELMSVAEHEADELAELKKALARSVDLVQQLQLLAGYALTQPRSIKPAELVNQVVEAFRVVHPRAELETAVGPALPSFSGDPKLLRQALSELLGNALDAGPDGRPMRFAVTVVSDAGSVSGQAIRRADPASSYVQFTVQDSGNGMTEGVRKRAFDPYFSTKPNGRGLGLSMVAGIARAHRGGLYLDSIPNSGTRISLLIPVDPGPPQSRNPSRDRAALSSAGWMDGAPG